MSLNSNVVIQNICVVWRVKQYKNILAMCDLLLHKCVPFMKYPCRYAGKISSQRTCLALSGYMRKSKKKLRY